MVHGGKLIGTGLATIGLIDAGVGIGLGLTTGLFAKVTGLISSVFIPLSFDLSILNLISDTEGLNNNAISELEGRVEALNAELGEAIDKSDEALEAYGNQDSRYLEAEALVEELSNELNALHDELQDLENETANNTVDNNDND